jgi:hypothetical protein
MRREGRKQGGREGGREGMEGRRIKVVIRLPCVMMGEGIKRGLALSRKPERGQESRRG